MKRNLVVLLFIFTSNLVLLSQSDFKSGYIITNEGEKIEGWINSRNNYLNGKLCIFKKDSLAESIEYYPNQISAYRFNNSKYYVSKVVKLDNKRDSVFLECLISGKAILWRYTDQSKIHLFVEKGNSINEIENNDIDYYIDLENGNPNYVRFNPDSLEKNVQRVLKSNQYKGALKATFVDCPEIFPFIDRLQFDTKPLIDIFKTYHEKVCKDEQCIIYEKILPKHILNIGLLFDYGFHSLKFNDVTYGGSVIHLSPINPIGIGVLFQICNPDANENLYTQLSLNYNKFGINQKANTLLLGDVEYDFSFASLQLEPSLLYKMKFKKTNPLISVGIPVDILLDKNGMVKYRTQSDLNIVEKYMVGVSGGVGLERQIISDLRLVLMLKYDWISSVSATKFNSFSNSGLQFSMGFVYLVK
jgi:hypothetical protein